MPKKEKSRRYKNDFFGLINLIFNKHWPLTKITIMTIICAFKDCQMLGTEYISDRMIILPAALKTIDQPIQFCKNHIDTMCQYYAIYKALEAKLTTDHLMSFNRWSILRDLAHKWQNNAGYHQQLSTLSQIAYDLELCIKLREQFQTSLKFEISQSAHGHQWWLSSLRCKLSDLQSLLRSDIDTEVRQYAEWMCEFQPVVSRKIAKKQNQRIY